MAEVKFANAAKYKGLRYPAHTPFEVDDKDVESLVQQGAIVTKAPVKSIDDMKVEELKDYAEAHGINITGAEKKKDILAAIKAAESAEKAESEVDAGEAEE